MEKSLIKPVINVLKDKFKVLPSIEDASLLRQFSIFFLLMSFIPTTILFYFYTQLKTAGNIQFTIHEFNILLIFVVLGVGLGYGAMRTIIKDIINLSQTNRRVLETFLNPDKLKKLNLEQNEISVLTQSFSAITARLEDNVKSLEMAKKTLHSVLSKVGQGISSMQNIDTFLELILETITEAMNGKIGMLFLWDEKKQLYVLNNIFGVDSEEITAPEINIKNGSRLETMITQKRPLYLPNRYLLMEDSDEFRYLFEPPSICSPLVLQDSVKGFLCVTNRVEEKNQMEEDEKNLLFNVATQTAIAIENSKLNADIERTYFETISALALAVDAKDRYSRGHLDRVANYSVLIAKKLKLPDKDIKALRDAAKMHDLGKIGIPDEVLRKTGALTDQEWVLMRKHPEIGESIIKPVSSLRNLCDIVRHHHERLDGTGYPDGLKGHEITLLVRIAAVADIYDALSTDRSYRKRMTAKVAGEVLRDMKTHLDQEIVHILIEALSEEERVI